MTDVNAFLKPLFQPFRGGGLDLKNRFVMAPMTRYFAPNGVPDERNAQYYKRRAVGGVGLIITEGVWINHVAAGNDARCPRFYGDDALAGWKLTVDAVHDAGAKVVPQLWHVGAQKKIDDGPNIGTFPSSPSGLQGPNIHVGSAMTQADIDAAIDAYASGAADAKRLGFDGVELHAAHGYLIDQFFWPGSNLRTDGYGGGIANRVRFAVEIIEECRRRVGHSFPILLRFSQWKLPDYKARLFDAPDELEAFLDQLAAAGVDVFHVSVRRYWEPAFEGSPLTLAGWTKRISGKPTITVGSVGLSEAMGPALLKSVPDNLERVAHLFQNGEFDLVALGRMLIVNPEFVHRIRHEPIDAMQAFSPDMIRTHLGAGGPNELY
jgi:2,4-dienoyl-CoA reductase-like NADH-dependent reductase (Old Yellow Enzyme family)